ncbi:hypothetical protein JKF63_07717 [Porcisia hertigi]|uniref:FYVE-type domain-containing protein n=1 Tax=Porcisia hertigi TaxID=2761500 RepID=A0A836YJU7_9TRYP|nr:hypothetical protein JKF63_07717 [Porcisia hertigi]
MDISTHIGGMVPQNRWQPHQKVKVCQYQDCGASFTFFSSKYNCHRCGIVLCSTCASTTIVIPRHYNNEAVPVCRRCYRVIEHYKAHGPSTPGFVLHSATVSSTPARTSATPLAFATPAPPPRDITHHGATTEPSHTNIPEQNNLASLSSTRVTGTDIHGLQEVIRTLQTALLQEQSKYIAAASANDIQLDSMRDENVALKTALTLLQQQLLETDKPTPQLASSATELQQRLDLATRQRTDLETQVAQLEADRDEARGQQTASTADLQQRLDLATRQRTDLETQVAQLEADRDEARGQQTASIADLQQRLDLATRQRTDLEAQVAQLEADRDEARGQQVASTADLQQRLDLATRQRTDLETQVAQLEADRDEARGQQTASTADLQQRLDLATRQRTDLEAQVAQLEADRDEARGQQVASTADLQQRLDLATRQRTDLEAQVAQLEADRDEARGQQTASTADLQQRLDLATRQRTDLEAQVAQLEADRDEARGQQVASTADLQQRLDLATRQRTDLEAQVAQLEADRDEARGQQVASTADLQQRLDLATRQRTNLETQVAQLEADRDEARGQQVASTADLQQRLDLATRQRTNLEAHVASLTSELQTTKEKLHQAVSKAFAAMTRLSIMIGDTSVEASSLAATSSVTGVAAAVGEKNIYGPVEESPEEDAALVGEVGESLRKRGEAMRLSAEIVELRESTRPLEMVLVEKLAEDHRTSHAEGVVSECTQLPWNVAHARRLDKREALLKEKERLLLGAARDLQAKARALKAVHARAAESPPVKMLRVAADRDDVSKPSTPLLKQCCPRTPLRAPACQLESGVLHHKHTAGVAASNDPASPPPREPPRGPLLPRDVRIRSRSEVETQAADAEGGTHERLVVATEAYRDVLYEHILESNGLQRVDALVQYLPPQIPGCTPRTPQLLPSDVVAKTRAMLRALEKRIFSYRDVMREVDPTLQQRSLEALRRLEAAVGALCGDEEG